MSRRRAHPALALLLGLLWAAGAGAWQQPAGGWGARSPHGLHPGELALIVNDADPLSVRVGEYYRERRAIPPANVIHVQFPTGGRALSVQQFRAIKAQVDARTPAQVQAYALTWAIPYRVGCMSITTAFAAGFDEAFCVKGCEPTRPSPYYDSDSGAPHEDLGWRPAMALAGEDFEQVKALIDRGVAADATYPYGTGYLVSTGDAARNVRATLYPRVLAALSSRVRLEVVQAEALKGRDDVLFYFTGRKRVQDIASNTFLPGAVADHLTSAGGQLTDSRQMSALRWLEAGATGSYGTVVEPCAFVRKFPNPGVLIHHYLNGDTLIEAYWKSVAWPGQGIFVGEPLAKPFAFRPVHSALH